MTPEQLESLEDLRRSINNIAEFFQTNEIQDWEEFEKELDEEYRKMLNKEMDKGRKQ